MRCAANEARAAEALQVRPIIFAFGRIRAINAVISHRHGGPCDTDDGPVYLDLMLPFAVELAHRLDEATPAKAMRRFRYWLPQAIEQHGEAGFNDAWNSLAQDRSIALAHRRAESALGHVLWLPTAQRIADDLRLTHAERAAINATYPDKPPIRGIPVIDPPTAQEKRERDRQRKERTRRAAGVVPQSDRTKTAEREALAKILGCSSRTLQNHDRAGTLAEFIERKYANFQNVSAPYNLSEDGQFLETAVEDCDNLPTSEAIRVFHEIAANPFEVETWV